MKHRTSIFTTHNVIAISVILVLAVVMRLVPHPHNVTPVAALALFGGAYLDKRIALILPLLVMFVSDIFLGFHDTVLFVYGSFLLSGLLGMWVRTRKHAAMVGGVALLSSLVFFLITNFGVWMTGTMYPKTLSGLFEAYMMGLPFLRNTLLGDLLYTHLFWRV